VGSLNYPRFPIVGMQWCSEEGGLGSTGPRRHLVEGGTLLIKKKKEFKCPSFSLLCLNHFFKVLTLFSASI